LIIWKVKTDNDIFYKLYDLTNAKLIKSILKQLSKSITIYFINDFITIIKLFNKNDKNIKSNITIEKSVLNIEVLSIVIYFLIENRWISDSLLIYWRFYLY